MPEYNTTPNFYSPEDVLRMNGGVGPTRFHGTRAVEELTKSEGELTEAQEYLVREYEGFVNGFYLDSKNVLTYGAGLTGQDINGSFVDSYIKHEGRARDKIPALDSLPSFVKRTLVQSEYRGDLGYSPRAVALFNKKEYAAASEEFLDNDDYRAASSIGNSVSRRMKETSDAMYEYSLTRGIPTPDNKPRR